MQHRGWPHERFDAQPWDEIEALYVVMCETSRDFAPMLQLTRSIRTTSLRDQLIGLTSMHDLVVTTRDASAAFDVIVVHSASSLRTPAPGTVEIEHRAVSGKNERVARPVGEIVSLFRRFVTEKWGLVSDSVVHFPAMRREVMNALAVLADDEYQRKNWPRQLVFDDLTFAIHVLYDDAEPLPDPEASIGAVLVDGDEIGRLRALARVLDPVLDDHDLIPVQSILDDPRWPSVVKAAGQALTAMVRDGGLPWPS